MSEPDLIPHLFRTEYRKITAVLSKRFGLEHIEIAQDIASDTFLQASETWGIKGLPENPTAWLYAVAKNKAKDYLKRNTLFNEKIAQHIMYEQNGVENSGAGIDVDLSDRNIIADHRIFTDSRIKPNLRVVANGKEIAIQEAEKLNLTAHHLYHALLGELYTGIDNQKAVNHFKTSLDLANSKADQKVIVKKLSAMGY